MLSIFTLLLNCTVGHTVHLFYQATLFLLIFPPAGCGGPVTAPSGEIHSPSYPNSYPSNVDCSWVISVDPSHRVLLNFTDLDIEYHSNCLWDYVAVSKHQSEIINVKQKLLKFNVIKSLTITHHQAKKERALSK